MSDLFAEFQSCTLQRPKILTQNLSKNLTVGSKIESPNTQEIRYITFKSQIMSLSQTSYQDRTLNTFIFD